MTIKRYDLMRFNSSVKLAETRAGNFVQYADHARIASRLSGLILKALDVWWPFVHGTHASDAARNLRQELSDAIQPGNGWINTSDRLPPDETPVLIVLEGEVRIGELRWDHPGYEDTYSAYRYWDDPYDDGQDWQMHDVTKWAHLPQI